MELTRADLGGLDPKELRRWLNAVLREDLLTFLRKAVPTISTEAALRVLPYVEAMVYALERVASGETKRLIINLPPRHLKSTIVSVAFVAWLLGRNPKRKVIVASYGAELAAKFGIDFRTLVSAHWFRKAFPAWLLLGSWVLGRAGGQRFCEVSGVIDEGGM